METNSSREQLWFLKEKFLYPLILMGSIIASYATLKATTNQTEKIVDKQEETILGHETRISRVEEAVSQIPEIRQDIKDILKELRNYNGSFNHSR